MRQLRILATVGLLGAAATANADVSSTWALTNEYDFRGISQSAKDPALQGSLDFSMDNGWYVGAWASNVDFDSDVDYEVDLYTGFSGGAEDGLGWDVGFVYYAYPDDSDINYPEIYGKLSYDMFSGGVYYSNDWGNTGENSIYVTGDVSVPLSDALSLNFHAGYSTGDYFEDLDAEYFDYSVGIGYTVNQFNLSLRYVDTDLDRGDNGFSGDDVFNTEGRVIFSIATTFPWQND
ncbi:hypothetical protein JM946_24235 [Steroidobacter sp. S1-65]|uniref:TIGR02001 family outer membrane protein n=1 Tax=Steroidobacter gossypii TaxID=2805490 RepID=A0ABS1X3Q3_9GAMM|nr:TorF family putative porin [Steroidobacter gossypii]MBM0107855.1 hypothetical protein [Steroidobacter gossypii]